MNREAHDDDGADFTAWTDLVGERLGGAVVWANDEFFAPKERLIHAAEPVWREGVYTDRGKWMDGWETRRRREPGHDRCLLRLGVPGRVRGVVVDTRFFRGNYPQSFTLDGADLDGHPAVEELRSEAVEWRPLLAMQPLSGDSLHRFPVAAGGRVSHLRFSIFPDGGVARLRVHGEPRPDWAVLAGRGEVDLAAAEHGGRVVAVSDELFGSARHLLLPGPPRGMHDGWETRRKRGPQPADPCDRAVVRLAHPGWPRRLVIDTSHFKGNAPGSCAVDACAAGAWAGEATAWRPLLARTPLEPHTVHEHAVQAEGAASHLRLTIHPDGGVARLRAYGRVEVSEDEETTR
jgi:allantoicase